MATAKGQDPLAYSMGRRKARQSGESVPKPVPHGRKPGRKAFMLYLPPDLHTAIQMRKAITGQDMGDIMVGILEGALGEELSMVRRMRND